jgi:DNA repair exonuclease SbcCD ATPase subunit
VQDKAELQKELARKKQQALQYALEREQWSSGLQKQHTERNEVELEWLKLQLAEAKAECDAAHRAFNTIAAQRDSFQKEVETLKSSLAKANSRLEEIRKKDIAAAAGTHRSIDRWSRATAAAVGVFAVASVFSSIVIFHDAQSNVKNSDRQEASAVKALETVKFVSSESQSDSGEKPPPRSGKGKTLFAKAKAASSPLNPI